MNITLIAALDQNLLIGKNGHLPWHIPHDLAHFKQLTQYKPLIMGRKTHQSIGHILPDRIHGVLTRTKRSNANNCFYFASLLDALHHFKSYTEIMVIGGQTVFEACLPLANKMHLTCIHHSFQGDTFFPQWNKKEWVKIAQTHYHQELSYSFITFKKRLSNA